ncbi:MAG: DUF805 domain-containing protein [Planctomycetes bacterium]|nr:DUF805 domain-containing protein [Planctomycetota bacterium]
MNKSILSSFLNSYPFKNPNFFSFEGRLNRAKYILTIFILALIFYPIEMVWPNVGSTLGLIGVFSAAIKRCHDNNWSGAALIIMSVLPPSALVLVFKRGTIGTNKYGDDPLSKNKEK